jgi:hypothetical protein
MLARSAFSLGISGPGFVSFIQTSLTNGRQVHND